MKKIITLAILLCLTLFSYSQRSFHSLGWGLYEVGSYTNKKEKLYDYRGTPFKYQYRYNIFEFGNENSLSVNYTPTIGGFINSPYITNPLILKYDFGANSTYSSSSKRGFAFGTGFQTVFMKPKGYPIQTTIKPVTTISYTKYNKKRKRAFDASFNVDPLSFSQENFGMDKGTNFSITFNYYITEVSEHL